MFENRDWHYSPPTGGARPKLQKAPAFAAPTCLGDKTVLRPPYPKSNKIGVPETKPGPNAT